MTSATVDVEHLFTLRADVGSVPTVVIPDGPQGGRALATVTGGTFEGERLRGGIPEVAGGDWVTLRPNGTFKLDVRLILRTDDGVDILMTYTGVGRRGDDGVNVLRTAPQFEVGDERYAWLNDLQAVGIGRSEGGEVVYEVFGLR